MHWPNGKLRTIADWKDSLLIQEGFREDGSRWFEAEFGAVYDDDGFRRGGHLVNYKEYFKGTSIVKCAGRTISHDDGNPGFVPVEEWKSFYPSGSIRLVSEYSSMNSLCGKYMEYHENGRIARKGQYCVRMVVFDQPCSMDLLDGEMHQIFSGDESMPCGVWERYDQCGELMEVVTYEWRY
jgi:antitoxin component YwqK of YwqJK toxin-antitoxin module